MRQNPHVRICGGPGSATTLVYPTSTNCWIWVSTEAANSRCEVYSRGSSLPSWESVTSMYNLSSSSTANRVPLSTSSVTSSPSVPCWTSNSRGTATAAAMGLKPPPSVSCSTRSASVPRIATSSVFSRPSCICCRARPRCSWGVGSSSKAHSLGRRCILATFHDARTRSSSTSEKNRRVVEGTVRRFSFPAICEISSGGTDMNPSFDHDTPNAIGSTKSPVTQMSVTATPTTLRSSRLLKNSAKWDRQIDPVVLRCSQH